VFIAKSVIGPDHLGVAVEITTSVCSLPAVATQDWCLRAADAVKRVRPDTIAAVTLATVGLRGSIMQFEASGAAGADPLGRGIDAQLIHPEHCVGFNWWLDDSASASAHGVRAAHLHDLVCWGAWPDSASGRRWAKLGVADLIVASAPLGVQIPGRSLVVEVGVPSGVRPLGDAELAIIAAMMPHLVNRARLAFGSGISSVTTRLTHREQQVLEHLALGKSVKQIATDLARSPHTVHDHVKSLHRKMNASSRGELIARALGHLAACQGEPAADHEPDFEPHAAPAMGSKVPTLLSA
jgi:DNA-binding CsgD family transcriptional regulator